MKTAKKFHSENFCTMLDSYHRLQSCSLKGFYVIKEENETNTLIKLPKLSITNDQSLRQTWFLDWWPECTHSFYLREKQKKSSVIRSISPEWKTGFLKQIQGDKEFHKIEIWNSFSIGFQNTESNMQSLFLNIKKMWVKVYRMKK